jgi:alkylation response protein AidB-like acyl-CoA dehydrogenase
MANYFTDNEDLQYYFDKGIDWDSIVQLTEYAKTDDAIATTQEAVELYRDMLEMFGKLVAEEVAPIGAEVDRIGAELVDGEAKMPPAAEAVFAKIRDLDLHWLCLPRELGGMNVPLIGYFIGAEMFARADVSMMTHFGFHGGMAMAMLVFSIREGTTKFDPETREILETRFSDYIEEIGNGEAWGTMDITEPDAGSDMARLRAKGEQDADGNWFVTGQKIFITSGHGKYHFVIARTEDAGDPNDPFAGLGGLSFFLVPAYEDHADGTRTRLATVDRLEEKLGHHGSVTATISFDRTPAFLIGERGEGFKHMLTLMNNARLGVGFESIGLCENALRLARAYAAERPSMGKTIDKHEMIADYLDEMEVDVKCLRVLAMTGAQHEEIGQKIQLALDQGFGDLGDELDRKRWERDLKRRKREARRITPLLKYLAAERAVEMAKTCIQIHGGNGYTKEYGAEKLLRDAMVMPIYEGTSQIQSLMVIKDTLGGIIKNPQRFVREMAQNRWLSLSARDPLERRVAKLRAVGFDAQQVLIRKTAADKMRSLGGKPMATWSKAFFKDWNPKRDFAHAMLHAERFTRMMCDVVIAELLLEQAQKHPERRPLLAKHLERAEPRGRYLLDVISTTGQRLLDQLDESTSAAESQTA